MPVIEGIDTEGEDAVAEMRPGIALSLMLTGHAEARCGRSKLSFGPVNGGAIGSMMAFEDVERSVRKRTPAMPIAYVGLTMTREWIEGGHEGTVGAFKRFASHHLEKHQWRLSTRTAWLTRRLLDTPAGSGVIERLQAESQALELVADVFTQMDPEHADLSPPALARVKRVRALIEEAPESIEGMSDLARYAGVNATSLQQQFSAVYGMTIFACIRAVRLARAVEALRDGETIANAAYLSGYSNPANFATAVKRCYGVTPSALRTRRLPS